MFRVYSLIYAQVIFLYIPSRVDQISATMQFSTLHEHLFIWDDKTIFYLSD